MAKQHEDEHTHQLGNVVYSVLTPDLFREQNGNGWFLLDSGIDLKSNGIKPNETDLCNVTGSFCQNIPDARGVFVRGMNLNRDKAQGDEKNDRNVGDYQDDSFQGHNHFEKNKVAYRAGKNTDWDRQVNNASLDLEESEGKYSAGEEFGEPRISSETRPKNITLYVYIKLNIK